MHASTPPVPISRGPEAAPPSRVPVAMRCAVPAVILCLLCAASIVVAAPSIDTAPVVCVSDHFVYDVKGGGKSAVIQQKRVYAVRRLGDEADRLRSVVAFSGYEAHPRSLEATVTGANGVKLVKRLEEFLDVPAYSYGTFISDTRARVTQLPPFKAGDTLTIVEKTEIDPFLGFPPYVLGETNMPTLDAVYEARIDDDLSPSYRGFSGAGEPVEHRDGGKVIWTWRAGPLNPPEAEALSAPPEDLFPTVSIGINRMAWGPCATWEEIAASYWSRITAETFAEVGGILTADRSEEGLSTCERVLARVQDNVRYVAIELGEGGKIPHTAADVFRRRYGDCKDMATLILAALRAEGTEGSLALVRTRPPAGYAVEPLPTLQFFNHAIACVASTDGLSWLDATDSYGTTLNPRSDSQGAPTLVVTGPNRGFHRIPFTPASGNRSCRTLRIFEDSEGNWAARYTLSRAGARAQDLNRHLGQGGDTTRVVSEYFDTIGVKPVAPLVASSLSIANDRPDSIRVECALSIAPPVSRDAMRIPFRPLLDSDPFPINVFKTRDRETPVHWRFLETLVDTFEVRSRRLLFEAPPDTSWAAQVEGMEITVRSEPLADGFRLTRSIAFTRPVFPVDRWEEGRELRRRMIRCCTREVFATPR